MQITQSTIRERKGAKKKRQKYTLRIDFSARWVIKLSQQQHSQLLQWFACRWWITSENFHKKYYVRFRVLFTYSPSPFTALIYVSLLNMTFSWSLLPLNSHTLITTSDVELCAVIGSPKVESRESKSNVKFSISECVVCVYFRGRLHIEAKLCHPYR